MMLRNPVNQLSQYRIDSNVTDRHASLTRAASSNVCVSYGTESTKKMAFLRTVYIYSLACFYGLMVSLHLLYSYIRNPSKFPVKERKNPPKCLTDPINGTHGYLSLKDIKIHYVEKGDRTKPLMLFVHGYPEFWYSWRYQMKEFSKDYWTVAIDMRGYGDSEKPNGIENYYVKYLIDDIKHVVEGLGRKKFILVAHDWGGVIAWSFVQKYPEMLERYIIMNAPYSPAFMEVVKTNKKQFKSSWYVFFYQLPYLPELLIRSFDFRVFKVLFKAKTPKTTTIATDEDIEAFKYTFSKPGSITPPINYYRANFGNRSSDGGRIKEIDIPAPGLFLFGEKDDYLVLDHLEIGKKYVKNLVTKIVKDFHSWRHLHAAEVIGLIVNILKPLINRIFYRIEQLVHQMTFLNFLQKAASIGRILKEKRETNELKNPSKKRPPLLGNYRNSHYEMSIGKNRGKESNILISDTHDPGTFLYRIGTN
ncbi:hypothetical protein L9F63_008342, partial [Diploptera punctata]